MLQFQGESAKTVLPYIFSALCVLAIGYLLGSTPSGYLTGRWLKGIDLRDCGSGSTGATNVLRNVGKKPALAVFLVDVGKGALAVLLAKSFGMSDWIQVLAGLAALAGHIWPVWLGWKGVVGGKPDGVMASPKQYRTSDRWQRTQDRPKAHIGHLNPGNRGD